MKKVNWQKAKRKIMERTKAGESFWERINADPDFIQAKREIQARYRLPVPYDIRIKNAEWIKWMGYDEKPTSPIAKRGQALRDEVDALLKRFEIPPKWHFEFFAEITGTSIMRAREYSSFPEFIHHRNDDGTFTWQCIITAETDLTNPLYLYMIQEQQKKHTGDPPKPVKDKMNRRKLDWRPVYEWRKRHPLFTVEEIAQKLHYKPQTVRQKIAELESDK